MSDEINIREMPLDELLELMGEDLYDGYADEVVEEVREALSRGMTPYDVLTRGLVAGMEIVGDDFRDGILFVPEVLMAAKAMKAGMEKGDIHDIGKNLVAMMMEGAGFEVINLGINTDVDEFMGAIRQHNPDIIGMSALLTTTMPYMRVVIDALKEAGIRDDLIVLVGGAPLNDAFAEDIGADAYCRDAAVAVDTAKKLMVIKRGRPVEPAA